MVDGAHVLDVHVERGLEARAVEPCAGVRDQIRDVRLRTHCNYFLTVMQEKDSNGKKLGFISQEIGREINTLGAKANDAQMQQLVVGMKDDLEKIKEQLLNIL